MGNSIVIIDNGVNYSFFKPFLYICDAGFARFKKS